MTPAPSSVDAALASLKATIDARPPTEEPKPVKFLSKYTKAVEGHAGSGACGRCWNSMRALSIN